MNNYEIPETPEPCPGEMPVSFFGANYQDSRCINGEVFDMDCCDDQGNLYLSKEIPCPFCNPADHTEYMIGDYEVCVCEICDTPLSNLLWAITSKPSVKMYGHCDKCQSKQWAKLIEE